MKMMKKLAAVLAATVVTTMSVASLTVSADLPAREDPPYTAFLAVQAGADAKWVSETDSVAATKNTITGTEASITGNGSYSVDVTMVNGSGSIEAMILSTDINAYAFSPEGATCPSGSLPTGCTASIVVDSIEIQHIAGGSTPIAYAGEQDGSLRTADDGTSIRVNILNVWTNPKVNSVSSGENLTLDAEGGLAAGDKLVVNFTVSGIAAGGGDADAAGDDTAATTTTAAAGDGNTTTTAAAVVTDANGNVVTTTAAAGNSSGNSSNTSSSGNSSSGTSGNATTSQTGDFGIAAVALAAVATAALGVGAYTITKRKK